MERCVYCSRKSRASSPRRAMGACKAVVTVVAVWSMFTKLVARVEATNASAVASTTLADLFTLLFAANPFSAARASLRRWSSDEFEDGLAHGGRCRSRRRAVDFFFPPLLFL